MSGNRTKIDWAYYKAIKLRDIIIENGSAFPFEAIRKITASLRAAYRKGKKDAHNI